MKKWFELFAFGLMFLVASCQKAAVKPAAKDRKIIFGIQPNEASQNFSELVKEIHLRTGLQVEFRNAKDYRDLIDQMSAGKVDIGFFSPLNFVEIEKKGGVKVLLKKVYGNSEFYYSSIIAQKKSSIKQLKGLKGKKIAFVDRNSASGFLYPKLMLHNQGLDTGSYEEVLAGTHEEAVKLLAEGKVDAAAVWVDDASAKSGAWTKLNESGAVRLSPTALSVSAPIPNDALVVRESLYNESSHLVLKMMDALISISEDTKILKNLFGADRLVTATSRHYESVRELDHLLNTEK